MKNPKIPISNVHETGRKKKKRHFYDRKKKPTRKDGAKGLNKINKATLSEAAAQTAQTGLISFPLLTPGGPSSSLGLY